MPISISIRKISAILIITAILLNIMGFLGQVIEHFLNYHGTSKIVKFFHCAEEMNLTTWFSCTLLTLSGFLLFIIADAQKHKGIADAKHWRILSIIFFYLSLDEMVSIHELAIKPLRNFFNTSGFFYHAWVIIALPLILLFVIFYRKFLINLQKDISLLFIAAGAIYLFGAVGMEMLGGYILSYQVGNWVVITEILYVVEELSENLGIILFIFTLLSYMERNMSLILKTA